MEVKIEHECGYDFALRGMAYSYKDRGEDLGEWWTTEKFEKAEKRAKILAHKGGGHNKFLESIQVWIDVEAPRSFWQEFDTYRIGITKQSESTMHTLKKRAPVQSDFEKDMPIQMLIAFRSVYDQFKEGHFTLEQLKESLPEGFLQRRITCLNYRNIQHIYMQRHDHRYLRWREFNHLMLDQLEHPEFIKE